MQGTPICNLDIWDIFDIKLYRAFRYVKNCFISTVLLHGRAKSSTLVECIFVFVPLLGRVMMLEFIENLLFSESLDFVRFIEFFG